MNQWLRRAEGGLHPCAVTAWGRFQSRPGTGYRPGRRPSDRWVRPGPGSGRQRGRGAGPWPGARTASGWPDRRGRPEVSSRDRLSPTPLRSPGRFHGGVHLVCRVVQGQGFAIVEELLVDPVPLGVDPEFIGPLHDGWLRDGRAWGRQAPSLGVPIPTRRELGGRAAILRLLTPKSPGGPRLTKLRPSVTPLPGRAEPEKWASLCTVAPIRGSRRGLYLQAGKSRSVSAQQVSTMYSAMCPSGFEQILAAALAGPGDRHSASSGAAFIDDSHAQRD